MTTHTAITEYYAGATLDAGSLLCHRTTDAVIETASATSELTAGGGVYSVVFGTVAAGSYRLKLLAGGEVVATRLVKFAGTDGEVVLTGQAVELDSAVTDQLDDIQAKTDLIGSAAALTELFAAAVLEPGSITSFPETLRVGDSYTQVLGRGIQVPIVDTDGVPLTAAGTKDFADATATFVIKRANDTETSRIITGSATFVDPPGTGTGESPYALVELPSSETAKGLVKYRYTGLLTFTWPYVGTGTDSEVMTFETGTITFEA